MRIISGAIIFLLVTGAPLSITQGKVTGECVNCHTMHNSQNGADLQATPQPTLLTDTCVGCHSSATGDTIATLGNTNIPIVWNTGASYPVL